MNCGPVRSQADFRHGWTDTLVQAGLGEFIETGRREGPGNAMLLPLPPLTAAGQSKMYSKQYCLLVNCDFASWGRKFPPVKDRANKTRVTYPGHKWYRVLAQMGLCLGKQNSVSQGDKQFLFGITAKPDKLTISGFFLFVLFFSF